MSQPNWRPNPPHREPAERTLAQRAEPLLRALLNRFLADHDLKLEQANVLEFEQVILSQEVVDLVRANDHVVLASRYEVSEDAAEAAMRLLESTQGVAELRHIWHCLILSGLPALASPAVAMANSTAVVLEDGTVIHILGGCRVNPGTPITEPTLLALQQHYDYQVTMAMRTVGLERLRQNVITQTKFRWDPTQVHPADLLKQGLAHFIRNDPRAKQMEVSLLPYADLLLGILNRLAPPPAPPSLNPFPPPVPGGISG